MAWEAALAKEAKAKQLVLEARWLLLEAEKVPFDADLLGGNDGGSPETTPGSPMNRTSPYRSTKKAVKSLVVSI